MARKLRAGKNIGFKSNEPVTAGAGSASTKGST